MNAGSAGRAAVGRDAFSRPRLSRETVEHFRGIRITNALALECVDRGYRATTIAHVVSRAKTSRNTVYEQFESKEAIFLALLERVLGELVERVDLACAAAEDPPGRIEAGLGAALDWAAADPAAAHAAIVQPPAVSERAFAMQAEVQTGFAERLRSCSPTDPPRPTSLEELLVGGVTAILGARIISGGAVSLPLLLPGLTAFLTEPLLGA